MGFFDLLQTRCRHLLQTIFAAAGTLCLWSASSLAQSAAPVPSLFHESQLFLSAVAAEKPSQPIEGRVTGIGVPHHLLAANLIARGFWTAAHNAYQRIIIISPDHFGRSRRPFATTRRDFETPFGTIQTDRAMTNALLANRQLFDESDLFDREHGVEALLPFVKYFFPDARVVAIVASYASTRADWDRTVEQLREFADDRTLIIQSTDYSHYLPLETATRRDQETLNVIASGNLDALNGLVQPDHLDSKAAQYIQMRLQAEVYKAAAAVIANRDSTDFGSLGAEVTTYVVTAYSPQPDTSSRLRYADQEVIYFGGDTFVGRWFTEPLAKPATADMLVGRVLGLTGGAPLIVNLEGVLLDEPPPGLSSNLHFMYAELAVRILKSMNVRAASLANNHSYDLGSDGFAETVSILKRAGVQPLRHMEPTELGGTGITAINFIGVSDHKRYPVIKSNEDLQKLCAKPARTPLVAFTHWGDEFEEDATPAQYQAADLLRRCGVGIIIGAHSHRASRNVEVRTGGEYLMLSSLGNLLFDQRGERVSGALLELRRFAKGTVATRLIAIPNLFELSVGRPIPRAAAAQQ
ncbi:MULTISPECIES: AmmeMemoRadiSam system protein B [unclassified Bradyrhizobium]|uniref:AmmeMemoRadiSam system protein B n=1 Tax=unclassified Bradyrhizobium TaxID=2631580 RepID=UPI002916D22F|nr:MULTISPECIES: AmmeMemoRadiSam system protein B [unclassified Bradyrhizobium]